MTLIATYINQFGIVHASDSNLTKDKGNSGFGQKVFSIPHLNSGLTYSGAYSINGISVDIWMNEFISGSFFTTTTLEEFCKQISDRMSSEMRNNEINEITIIHLSGYIEYENHLHLEFWHISNTELDEKTGNYKSAKPEFKIVNDFNSRTNPQHKNRLKNLDLNLKNHLFYINGYPPGRISYMIVKSFLDEALDNIWENSDWQFRRPNNIFETSIMIKLYFEFINKLFIMSKHKALYIGGEIQTHLIPVPQNLLKD